MEAIEKALAPTTLFDPGFTFSPTPCGVTPKCRSSLPSCPNASGLPPTAYASTPKAVCFWPGLLLG